MVVARDLPAPALLERLPPNTLRVTTMLDMIARLDDEQRPISTVVLVGSLADDVELVSVLHELYPKLEVVDLRTLGH
jgi:hypothetical protein